MSIADCEIMVASWDLETLGVRRGLRPQGVARQRLAVADAHGRQAIHLRGDVLDRASDDVGVVGALARRERDFSGGSISAAWYRIHRYALCRRQSPLWCHPRSK
jgi:hypothetical protein